MKIYDILPFLIAIIDLYKLQLLGREDKTAGWKLGLITNTLFLVWVILAQGWGFIPCTIVAIAITWQNLQLEIQRKK